jgi:dipeptidyl aminopeptidase/acylaminoacyl peptidase
MPLKQSILLIAVFAVVPIALAACLTAQDKPRVTAEQLILPGEVFEVDGKQAFVLQPEESKRSKPQPWIMYAPTLLPQYPDKHEKWMHEQFLSAGVAVVGVDVGEAYGNPKANDVIDNLYSLMVNNQGFGSKPCLFGRSRGGLWVSSWAIRNPDKVAGIIAIYPVFDLTTYPGISKAATAYGLTAETFETQLAQYNPIQNIGKLAEAKIPVTIIHGAVDEVVPLKQNSAKLQQAYKDAGQHALVKLIVIADQGHNFWPGFFNCQELVDFAIAKAKP